MAPFDHSYVVADVDVEDGDQEHDFGDVGEHLDDQDRAKVMVEDVREMVEVIVDHHDQLVDEAFDRAEEAQLGLVGVLVGRDAAFDVHFWIALGLIYRVGASTSCWVQNSKVFT